MILNTNTWHASRMAVGSMLGGGAETVEIIISILGRLGQEDCSVLRLACAA